jgi:AmmeMemoRadiSam system protein A
MSHHRRNLFDSVRESEEKIMGKGRIFSITLSLVCMIALMTDLKPCMGEEGKAAKEKKEADMPETGKLSEEEGRYLLSVARNTIKEQLAREKGASPDEAMISPKFSEKRGTFVTLTMNHNLRGCIGHIIPQETLLEGVKVNALNAAFRDPRFRPLSAQEFEKIRIEVSILTEPRPLDYKDSDDLLMKLRSGIDGVIIKKGFHQATFLPQVWDQLPDKKEFLRHLCLKAGLDDMAWSKEKLEVSTYQVQAFEE